MAHVSATKMNNHTRYNAFLVFDLKITNSSDDRYLVFLDDEERSRGQSGPFSQQVYNNLGDDNVFKICFWETDTKKRKSGLLVRGIELRPSNDP
ncbi:hypothetical protein ACJIZ3_003466 [Penstemon smallii]|uniref:Uncharacterized protein n=1 Tax=Penstemon smallii TaxID=265156 RepID=A0ABD3UD56_9LAMI